MGPYSFPGKAIGEVVFHTCGGRQVYFLVTKEYFWQTPLLQDLRKSLLELAVHCREHGVKTLAMPPVGCDQPNGLAWHDVRAMLEEVFDHTGINVTIYKNS